MPFPNLEGRPRIFSAPEELQEKINEYFQFCDDKKESFTDSKGNVKIIQKPYTMSGLCVYLKINKDTLWEYGKKPGFSEVVKEAKSRVENYCEENTMSGKLNPIFSIFSLKNNFGWTDRIEVNTNTQPEQLTPDDIKDVLRKRNKGNKE